MTERLSTGQATIEDVAREAGVSRAAVSKVIRDAYGVSDSMRERVNAAIERLGYRPRVSARAMRGSTFTLGIEIPEFDNQFFSKILAGTTTALVESPYQLIIAPTDPSHLEGYRAIEALADRQVDGIIAISPLVDPEWLENLAARVPIVMIGRHDDSIAYDTVVGDDVAGARLVMQHLLGLGHERIAHLTRDELVTTRGSGTPHALRLETYSTAMLDAGFGSHIRIARCDAGEEHAYRAALELLSEPERPTAVFAGNDQLAMGLLRATAELGVTEDVSVVGYDDIAVAAHPLIGLTTVSQAGNRLGGLAVELLLERVAGRTAPSHAVVTPELVVRTTTRPPHSRRTPRIRN